MMKYKERYDAILASGKVIMEYTPDASYLKNSSYQRRNQYIVDKCDFLLAVWNGGNSGTGMTVHMAEKANKTCIKIDPKQYRPLVDTEKK